MLGNRRKEMKDDKAGDGLVATDAGRHKKGSEGRQGYKKRMMGNKYREMKGNGGRKGTYSNRCCGRSIK